MRTTRIFTERPIAAGTSLDLEEAPARHLRTVLRLRVGDELLLFDGSGSEFGARLGAITRNRVTAAVGERVREEPQPPLHITLVQAVAKGEHMEYALQKAVELGISRFAPVLTEYGVVRLTGERLENRRQHWRRIAIGACEQCGRAHIPEILPPRPLQEWLDESRTEPASRLTLDPTATRGLKDVAAPSGAVHCLIGPEGGLTAAEVNLARELDYLPIRFGPRILRTETAAAAVITAVQVLWGDLAS